MGLQNDEMRLQNGQTGLENGKMELKNGEKGLKDGDHVNTPNGHRSDRGRTCVPSDTRDYGAWLGQILDHIDKHGEQELLPVLQEFRELITSDPRFYMYFTGMWEEIPVKEPDPKNPTVQPRIRDYEQMLQVMNHVLVAAPEWTQAAASAGLAGVPLVAMFDEAMSTPSGHAAFLDPDVNLMFKKILNAWGKYLQTPESVEVLGDHENGWFCQAAFKELLEVANAPYNTSFRLEELYKCDPSKEHFGFKSWDDFFTRQFHESVRPVASPDDDNVIASPCESTILNIAYNSKLRDKFWIKGLRYSVADMLGHDPLAEHFAGATVCHAFLSAMSYHRWHAPVSGKIKRCFVQEGTYFSISLSDLFADGGDAKGHLATQGYASAMATRGIVFVEADNPAIGLVAFIAIGLTEVSTCEITVTEGQRVQKGDEIGMFHFGGSACCLLLQNGVRVSGFPEIRSPVNVPVRGRLAVVQP
ncbi:hypothetical protein MYCTH_2308819 [Thermothelomyces thermophilus ATCC 42464]|uniref:L-tryptophan decarboxylase PsiD-like domain-containing protein n=1 Tax=Thermothelomyces thermophilus (strain ATCC 42464 / BCRC 31852 / DSM 1799) TaxID=573729 RepID=G2QKB7_THET4|nr:uncharacterized protein MYCTH_2308819 [Thermothelomyces thermophilus ATCC 42464]AEO60023.1 hypothetical protein MYCTH_2308819 [Thermothelomyces thermophilus ATCC 42464]